jgi:hypothetical protein
VLAGGNPLNYVEADGHMALLDETGGKPLAGYGSGANGGSPVATAAEAAAMLDAQADALAKDANAMCRGTSASYEFAGGFCKAVASESLTLRNRANILGRQPSLSNAGTTLAVVSFGADIASGMGRTASAMEAAVKRGSSYAKLNAGRAATLAKKAQPLARASVPVAIAGVLIEATNTRNAARAAVSAVASGLAVAGVGATCALVGAETGGVTAFACLVVVPAAGYYGGQLGRAFFDATAPKSAAGRR